MNGPCLFPCLTLTQVSQATPKNHETKESESKHPKQNIMTVETALVQTLLKGLIQGNRVALSKSITLIESVKREHRVMASQLLDSILDCRASTISSPLSSAPSSVLTLTPYSTHESKGMENTTPPSKLSQIAYKSPRPTPRLENVFRIGLSGSPGVGKSSFIEAFGLHLISLGHRVAVLVSRFQISLISTLF